MFNRRYIGMITACMEEAEARVRKVLCRSGTGNVAPANKLPGHSRSTQRDNCAFWNNLAWGPESFPKAFSDIGNFQTGHGASWVAPTSWPGNERRPAPSPQSWQMLHSCTVYRAEAHFRLTALYKKSSFAFKPSPWVCRFRWHGSCSCAPGPVLCLIDAVSASSLQNQASPSIHLVDCDIAEIGFLHHLISVASPLTPLGTALKILTVERWQLVLATSS